MNFHRKWDRSERDRLLFKVWILCFINILTCKYERTVTWKRNYGGEKRDFATFAQQTSDGGYIAVGGTASYGADKGDIWIIKTNPKGKILWKRTYGGEGTDIGGRIQQTKDGGYIIIGYTESYGIGNDIYLIKTDSKGDILWTKTYGGYKSDIGNSVQQTKDGGYILVGGTQSYGRGKRDIWLIRTNPKGDVIWTKTYGGDRDELGISVKQTSDNGYIIAGNTKSYGAGLTDIWLVKINSIGETLWTKTFGGERDDKVGWVEETDDGGYIVVGQTFSYGINGDVWLIKTNPKGDTLWTKVYGDKGEERGYCVCQTKDSGYVIVGYTESYNGRDKDLYLIKTDSKGETLWTRVYGGGKDDVGVSVQQTADNGYIIAGWTSSYSAGECDAWLIKTDSLGNIKTKKL